ncbi:MAG: radical SAM protein [Clostridiales bacterium]|nr:radical SAM protein [Clostridiales bacterium]
MVKEFQGKYVTIMSCSDCNIKCKHCYISYGGNFSGDQLYEMVSTLQNKYEVMINGTEPLMHKEFLKSYKLINIKSPITNGLVFKDNYNYIDELKQCGINELRISYHFDLHEQISQVDKAYLENLFKEIRKRGLKLCLMCSITSNNYKNIPIYCKKAVALGATAIKFTNFLSQGRAKNLDSNLILSQKQIYEFFEIINEVRTVYDKNILEIRRCGSFGNDLNHKCNFKCDAGIGGVCITPDCNVYPCIFLCKKGNEIGYYKDGKIYIDTDLKFNSTTCMAKDILNNKNEVI